MWLGFEFVIIFFLFFVAVLFLHLFLYKKSYKKQRLLFACLWALGFSWIVIFYGSYVEPRLLIVNEQEVYLSDEVTNVIHAVVLSDIHVGPYKNERWVDHIVKNVNKQKPDIVFIVGDFISNSSSESDMLYPLADIIAPFGVYVVTGNHDHIDGNVGVVENKLNEAGLKILNNSSEIIDINNKEIVIAGVSDVWYGSLPSLAMKGVSEDQDVILLAHNPDVVLYSDSRIADLVIAGHTHGGQIRLPFLGSVPQIPTYLGNKYDRGLFEYNNQKLFITSGVSETGPRARLFVPPEIVNLHIHY